MFIQAALFSFGIFAALAGILFSFVKFVTSIGGAIRKEPATLALARKYPNSPHGVILRLYEVLYPDLPNFLFFGQTPPLRDVDGLIQLERINFIQLRVRFFDDLTNYHALVRRRMLMAGWFSLAIFMLSAGLAGVVYMQLRTAEALWTMLGAAGAFSIGLYGVLMNRITSDQFKTLLAIRNDRVLRIVGDIIYDPYYGGRFDLASYKGPQKIVSETEVSFALAFQDGVIPMVATPLALYKSAGDANLDYIIEKLDETLRARGWRETHPSEENEREGAAHELAPPRLDSRRAEP